MKKVQRDHRPPGKGTALFAAAQGVVLAGGLAWLLWNAQALPIAHIVVWLAALCAGVGAVGALLRGRIGVLELLVIEAGALTTAGSATGLNTVYAVFKPLALVPADRLRAAALACAALAANLRCLAGGGAGVLAGG